MDEDLDDAALATRRARLDGVAAAEARLLEHVRHRATLVVVAAVVVLAGAAGLSAVWLDGGWSLEDGTVTLLQVLLVVSLVAAGLAVASGVVAAWPRAATRAGTADRVRTLQGHLSARADAQLALSLAERRRAAVDTAVVWQRWAAALLAAAAGLLGGQGVVFGLAADAPDRVRALQCGPAQPQRPSPGTVRGAYAQVARDRAPVVYLHPAEDLGPLHPDRFLEGAQLLYRRKGGRDACLAPRGGLDARRIGERCDSAPGGCLRFGVYDADEFTRPNDGGPDKRRARLDATEGFHLAIDPALHRGELVDDPDVPMYVEVHPPAGGIEHLRLTYWFFYAYSRPHKPFLNRNLAGGFGHQGDWENIDVILDRGRRNGRRVWIPREVFFYGHGSPVGRPWRDVERRGTHPVVYSARNSHASYRVAGTVEVCARRGKGGEERTGNLLCALDASGKGIEWLPWDEPGGLVDVKTQPWYGFGGAWGEARGTRDTTGPRGPSRYKGQVDPTQRPVGPRPGELDSAIKSPPGVEPPG